MSANKFPGGDSGGSRFDSLGSDFLDAYAAGVEHGKVQFHGDRPFVVLRDNQKVEDLERLLPAPLRPRGNAQLQDERSFGDYLLRHKQAGTVIFADADARKLVAVIDHHEARQPQWGEFRASLQLDRTPEWKAWAAVDRKALPQVAFVELIEDQMATVLAPDGAELLEVCQSLKGLKKVEFENGVSLRDGTVQLTYREGIESTSSRRGAVEVPERLVLSLPLFRNGPKVEVKARLRWRLDEGKVLFVVVLDKPVEAEDAAMAAVCERLGVAVGVPVLAGKP